MVEFARVAGARIAKVKQADEVLATVGLRLGVPAQVLYLRVLAGWFAIGFRVFGVRGDHRGVGTRPGPVLCDRTAREAVLKARGIPLDAVEAETFLVLTKTDPEGRLFFKTEVFSRWRKPWRPIDPCIPQYLIWPMGVAGPRVHTESG